MNKKNQTYGWIEVICGPMFSGKTEELIRRLKRAIIAKNKILVFKPEIDNRYSEDLIVSHNKNSIESTVNLHNLKVLFLILYYHLKMIIRKLENAHLTIIWNGILYLKQILMP